MAGETIKSLGLDRNLTRVLTILAVGAGLTFAAITYQRAQLAAEAEGIKAWAKQNFVSKDEQLALERRYTDFLLSAAKATGRP